MVLQYVVVAFAYGHQTQDAGEVQVVRRVVSWHKARLEQVEHLVEDMPGQGLGMVHVVAFVLEFVRGMVDVA